jgi:hypothetical protein
MNSPQRTEGTNRVEPPPDARRGGRWQHPMVMAVYVSVVLLAELALLPSDYGTAGRGQPTLEVLVWSTVVGLAVAHWFAFGVVAAGLGEGRVGWAGLRTATDEFLAAVAVGTISSVAILIAPDQREVGAGALGPSAMLGFTGYLIARAGDRSKIVSVLFGAVVLVAGLFVAAFKARIGFH